MLFYFLLLWSIFSFFAYWGAVATIEELELELKKESSDKARG